MLNLGTKLKRPPLTMVRLGTFFQVTSLQMNCFSTIFSIFLFLKYRSYRQVTENGKYTCFTTSFWPELNLFRHGKKGLCQEEVQRMAVGNVQHHLQFNFFFYFLKIIIEILSPGNISVQCEKVKETTESLSKMTLRKRYMTWWF